MSVQIISENERGSFDFNGHKYYYRRAPISKIKRWEFTNKNRRTGEVDWYAVSIEGTKYCLIGWEQGAVIDEQGTLISYSEEWVLDNADRFPQEFYSVLGDHIGISNINSKDKKEKELKNSKST